jgi:hypothetical protein
MMTKSATGGFKDMTASIRSSRVRWSSVSSPTIRSGICSKHSQLRRVEVLMRLWACMQNAEPQFRTVLSRFTRKISFWYVP